MLDFELLKKIIRFFQFLSVLLLEKFFYLSDANAPELTLLICLLLQEMSAPVVDRNDPVTGHIISTTIGGKNGEPKQV